MLVAPGARLRLPRVSLRSHQGAGNEARTAIFPRLHAFLPAKRSAHRAGCLPPVEHTSRVMCARQVNGTRAPRGNSESRAPRGVRSRARVKGVQKWKRRGRLARESLACLLVACLPTCLAADDRVCRRRHGWPPAASLCRFSLRLSPFLRERCLSPFSLKTAQRRSALEENFNPSYSLCRVEVVDSAGSRRRCMSMECPRNTRGKDNSRPSLTSNVDFYYIHRMLDVYIFSRNYDIINIL